MTDDPLEKEIESWQGFSLGLLNENKQLFKQMLEETKKYRDAICKKDNMPTEAILMALILHQQKMITTLLEICQKEQKINDSKS